MRLLGDKGRNNNDNTRILFKLLCLRSETVECVYAWVCMFVYVCGVCVSVYVCMRMYVCVHAYVCIWYI